MDSVSGIILITDGVWDFTIAPAGLIIVFTGVDTMEVIGDRRCTGRLIIIVRDILLIIVRLIIQDLATGHPLPRPITDRQIMSRSIIIFTEITEVSRPVM